MKLIDLASVLLGSIPGMRQPPLSSAADIDWQSVSDEEWLKAGAANPPHTPAPADASASGSGISSSSFPSLPFHIGQNTPDDLTNNMPWRGVRRVATDEPDQGQMPIFTAPSPDIEPISLTPPPLPSPPPAPVSQQPLIPQPLGDDTMASLREIVTDREYLGDPLVGTSLEKQSQPVIQMADGKLYLYLGPSMGWIPIGK